MPTIRHLRNAPIKEALIDIQVAFPPTLDVSVFESLRTALISDYPNIQYRMEWSEKLIIQAGVSTQQKSSTPRKVGLIFKSKDSTNLVQCGLNGFTVNKLKPYENWEDLLGRAKKYWELFLRCSTPLKITRIAVRYINDIPIPIEGGRITDIIRTAPLVPKDVASTINEFLNRVTITEKENQVIITQVFETGPKTKHLILDIDAFQVKDLGVNDNFWEKLEQLRDLKNRIFFNTLTDETIEEFK